ncbi:hypothetical protein NDU88_002900 [Pleurodeles waltl]|uniref:Uncharacterized protein n=1 Tax=Pleurodeles waltl TaxID=8319 RepID=A0AAV7WR84_PLEWA|nr:hypothetical protein NDU88_002900 [Pleurodeles waltl]
MPNRFTIAAVVACGFLRSAAFVDTATACHDPAAWLSSSSRSVTSGLQLPSTCDPAHSCSPQQCSTATSRPWGKQPGVVLVALPGLKQKASSSKKTYIHNYFTRARCEAGEGDEEGDPIIPQASQAPAALLCPIQEYVTVLRPTRTEHKREVRQDQEQELDSIRQVTNFGMGSSIIEKLVLLADTALDEFWNSPIGKNNDKDVPCGGAKRSNLYPVSSEYELEASGPAPTSGIVNLDPGKMKMISPSGNNRATVDEIHQHSQPQIEAVQANESTDKGRVCSTLLHGLKEASWEWPTILEQDDWPQREINMEAPSMGEGTMSPQEEKPPQNDPHKDRGDVVRPEYIIQTINASVLAAVKSLTWQSHKMEIHLELTHKHTNYRQ